jgi:hypothetical protein
VRVIASQLCKNRPFNQLSDPCTVRHATLACYKTLSKRNPGVRVHPSQATVNCTSLELLLCFPANTAMGTYRASQDCTEVRFGRGIAHPTSYGTEFEYLCAKHPRRVSDFYQRSKATVISPDLWPVNCSVGIRGRTQIAAGSTTVLGIGPGERSCHFSYSDQSMSWYCSCW